MAAGKGNKTNKDAMKKKADKEKKKGGPKGNPFSKGKK
jgi:hypothetical protein